MAYLFPCTCGKEISLEPRQAGEELLCVCGAKHTAPTMREIRQLPSTGEEETAPARNWSMLQGVLFLAGGLMVLVGLSTLGVLIFQRSQLNLERPTYTEEDVAQTLDPWVSSPAKSLELWENLSTVRLPPRSDQMPWMVQQRLATRNFWQCVAAGVFLAAGLALGIASILIPAPDPTRRQQRPPPGKKPASR